MIRRRDCRKEQLGAKSMKYLILAVGLTTLAGAAQAASIRNACMSSAQAANPRVCSCIQMAADQTLTRRDQKLAATFFGNPDKAEEVRMSKRSNHEAFWQRYKAFGAYATSLCS